MPIFYIPFIFMNNNHENFNKNINKSFALIKIIANKSISIKVTSKNNRFKDAIIIH